MPVQSLLSDNRLDTFWITFPDDPTLPSGIGITAFSEEDAFAIVSEQGLDRWIDTAATFSIARVRIDDLCATNIVPNIGPFQFRGVWYPAANDEIGLAPSLDGKSE